MQKDDDFDLLRVRVLAHAAEHQAGRLIPEEPACERLVLDEGEELDAVVALQRLAHGLHLPGRGRAVGMAGGEQQHLVGADAGVEPGVEAAANFEALKGRTVGGQIGTTGVFVARKSGVDMTLREYDDVGLAMQDLINGRIDAVICDSPVALYYANQKEGFTDHLSIAFRTEATESFGFVVRKGRTDLVDRLNKGIDAVRAKGIEAELIRKWMGE